MTKRENQNNELDDWLSEETLDLQPAPKPYDWLKEFADEHSEPVLPVEPRRRSLFRIEPMEDPTIEPPLEPRLEWAWPPVRLPVMMLAAVVVFVALVDAPGVQNRPWLLVPWVDVGQPPSRAEAVTA